MHIYTTPCRSQSVRPGAFPYARTMIAAGVLVVLAVPATGFAQEQAAPETEQDAKEKTVTELDMVYVTAERRRENLQKTAASVSVRLGDALRAQGKYSLKEILEDVPGIEGGAAERLGGSYTSGSDTLSSGLTIRGIPSNSGTGGSVTSVAAAAAIYVDDVYEGVGGGYDLERVEVLRGPQGTLYGRSATSGVVAIHTADPSTDGFDGHVSLEAGNYSLQHEEAAVNVPLTDTLAVRIAGNHYERDHYDAGKNAKSENSDAKLKLLYQPVENLSILLGAASAENKTHEAGAYDLDEPDSWEWANDPITPGENSYRQYWAKVDWDLGFANLTYLPAFRTWESKSSNSVRAGQVLSFDQFLETPYDHFTTHELHLSSNPDSKIAWQVGALHYDNRLRNHTKNIQVGDSSFYTDGQVLLDSLTSRKTTATGVFAEATFPFATDWRLTAGVRYDDTKVVTVQDYTASNGETLYLTADEGTREFRDFTYKARIEHDLTPQSLIYGMVSTGVSPGDVTVSTGADGGPEVVELQAETLTAYELGSKNAFLENTLILNGALYYYDYSAFQTAGIDTSSDPSYTAFTTLAAPMKSYGAELELLSRLTSNDRLSLSLAYTHARYYDKDKYKLANGTSFADYYGKDTVVGVAPVRASLAYEHDFELASGALLSLRGDVRYASAHDEGRITPEQLTAGYDSYQRVGDQVTGNLSATWTKGRYSVTGYVRNVADRRYKADVSLATGAGAFTTDLTAPRTFGVVLSMNFGAEAE